MKDDLSPAVQFIAHMYHHKQAATGHSWLKINHALHDALFLACRSGMRFDLDDFRYFQEHFQFHYWGRFIESFYRDAVLYRNASAYHAYEQYRGRTPFIVKGASITVNTGDGPAGHGLARLIEGSEFQWNGEKVKVTSFNDDKGYVNACSFVRDGDDERCQQCRRFTSYAKEKVANRYKITHQNIRDATKAAKAVKQAKVIAAAQLAAKLNAMCAPEQAA